MRGTNRALDGLLDGRLVVVGAVDLDAVSSSRRGRASAARFAVHLHQTAKVQLRLLDDFHLKWKYITLSENNIVRYFILCEENWKKNPLQGGINEFAKGNSNIHKIRSREGLKSQDSHATHPL